MSVKRFGDSSTQMRLSAGLVLKRVENRKGLLVEAYGEPCDRAGFRGDEALRAREESRDLLFLAGAALSSANNEKRVMSSSPISGLRRGFDTDIES